MNIHSLFILKNTGVCIYSRNITSDFDNIDPNLITPFFSALFSFSANVISKQTPEILEMGGFRIAFKVKGEFIYAILADSTASLLFIQFFQRFINQIGNSVRVYRENPITTFRTILC